MSGVSQLEVGQAVEQPAAKPPVDTSLLKHRTLLGGDFWRRIPAYRDLSAKEFHEQDCFRFTFYESCLS